MTLSRHGKELSSSIQGKLCYNPYFIPLDTLGFLRQVKDNVMNWSCLVHKLVMKNLDVEISEKTKGKIGMSGNGFINYPNYGLSNWAWKIWKKKLIKQVGPRRRVAGHIMAWPTHNLSHVTKSHDNLII